MFHMKHRKDITMIKSFAEILIDILEDLRKEEMEKRNDDKSEKCTEVLDRNITFGIRDRVCEENSCGLTECPFYVGRHCIANSKPTGIKVKIPTRIIDAEAEYRKENNR